MCSTKLVRGAGLFCYLVVGSETWGSVPLWSNTTYNLPTEGGSVDRLPITLSTVVELIHRDLEVASTSARPSEVCINIRTNGDSIRTNTLRYLLHTNVRMFVISLQEKCVADILYMS